MYIVTFKVKIRVTNLENKSGYSWLKQDPITLNGDTPEDLVQKAYRVSPPDNMDVQAMHLQAKIKLETPKSDRQHIDLDVFREL